MLIATLNCCTKEELDEEEETPMAITPEQELAEEDPNAERRQVIKNKILAVGRMSRVFPCCGQSTQSRRKHGRELIMFQRGVGASLGTEEHFRLQQFTRWYASVWC